ncbi:MAG: PucR family transcriptional regulator [Clostridiaceae bacterium]|nr:PucR family transcriptional regulator [Clostridiaceae bacterium]
MDELTKSIRRVGELLINTVGVVDDTGLVIACTDESRLGQKDREAVALIESGDTFRVTGKNTWQRLATRPGLNYYCFIEGSDPVALDYLGLLSEWLGLAVRDWGNESRRDNLLRNVLLQNELPGEIASKARNLGIIYTASRICILVRLEHRDTGGECVEVIGNLFPDRETDYVVSIDDRNIVLIHTLTPDDSGEVNRIAVEIRDNLSTELMTKVSIGIGMPAYNLRDCARSYRESALALEVGGLFSRDRSIVYYEKLGLGRLIYQMSPTLCKIFLDEVFPNDSYEALDRETLNTVEVFFACSLNGSETSRRLFVHRNTLVYRLDKVQKITGLDLRNFDDAVLFKFASMVKRYLERQGGVLGGAPNWLNRP